MVLKLTASGESDFQRPVDQPQVNPSDSELVGSWTSRASRGILYGLCMFVPVCGCYLLGGAEHRRFLDFYCGAKLTDSRLGNSLAVWRGRRSVSPHSRSVVEGSMENMKKECVNLAPLLLSGVSRIPSKEVTYM